MVNLQKRCLYCKRIPSTKPKILAFPYYLSLRNRSSQLWRYTITTGFHSSKIKYKLYRQKPKIRDSSFYHSELRGPCKRTTVHRRHQRDSSSEQDTSGDLDTAQSHPPILQYSTACSSTNQGKFLQPDEKLLHSWTHSRHSTIRKPLK